LTKYEARDGDQFLYAMEHADASDEDLNAILANRKKQSDEENRVAAEIEEEEARLSAEALAENEAEKKEKAEEAAEAENTLEDDSQG
ncbi:MAG: hypothetical protein J6W28_08400, partial [Clostridia bacterium]|nr:hypothetical protein [Clostridia bacterium]